MDRIDPRNLLGLVDRLYVEVNHDCFVVAAHKNTFERLILACINFLVRHERRHIDKIARSRLCRELKPFAPAHARLAAHYIDNAFQLAVMVRARLGVWLNAHRACPDFLRTDASKIDGGFAVHARRLGSVRIECITGDHTNAVMLPLRGMFVVIVAPALPLSRQGLYTLQRARREG
jgi:hypothetical protein